MNREILFRGKRIDNGEWVYGWYCMQAFGRWPIRDSIIPSEDAIRGCIEYFEVDSDTIEQFTGLTDKNGVKVFEGDIIQCLNDELEAYCLGVIRFNDAAFKIDLYIRPLERINFSVGVDTPSAFEVIGNIHDNLELLEVQS